MNEGKSLLIVGQLSERAAHTLNANVSRGVIKACHVIPPAHGWRMNELMTDLTKVFGATYFAQNSGDQLDLVEITDLALVDKVVVGESRTSIFTIIDASDYIAEIKEASKDKEFLKQRIANLSGSATTIYVGAATDIERKGKRDVYDDVVCAVNAALEDGVLPGGGVALFHAVNDVEFEDELIDIIMIRSLVAPFEQLIKNTGADDLEILEMMGDDFYDGVDLREMKSGNMLEMGIIDPARVTIDVIRNAFSVALTILDSDVIIVNQRQDESDR
jgi:chaperonin GroEL